MGAPMSWMLAATVLLWNQFLVSVVQADTVVTTTLGKLRGIEDNIQGEVVYKFLNVPFAEPPIKDLRFAKPEAAKSWTDVYNATSFGPSCAQNLAGNDKRFLPNLDVSEDCLYLNVFIPRTLNDTLNRAVMVWIHGGGYNVGQANMFDGSYLALTGDVIIVTTNYRVSVFGFMSLDDKEQRFQGNNGLWDQKLAIKWVKDNINAFGGNPSAITVFGESAGAMAVGLQVLSPHEHLFQRAICQSGVALGPTAVIRRKAVIDATRRTGLALHCPDIAAAEGDMEPFVECLRGKNTSEILTAIKTLRKPGVISFNPPFGPVVDKDFLPRHPKDLLKDKSSKSFKQFAETDRLFGNNNAEGLLLYLKIRSFKDMFDFDPEKQISRKILCEKVGPAMARDFFARESVSSTFCRRADDNNDAGNQTRLAVELFGDLVYTAPTVATAISHFQANSSTTFQYLFDHTPENRYILAQAPWFKGANHADEIFYVFGLSEQGLYPTNTSSSQKDEDISRKMMSYWTNFAKTGNPNGAGLTTWPEYGAEKSYMNIGPEFEAREDLFSERMEFLLDKLPEIIKSTSSANRLSNCFSYILIATVFFRIF